MHPQLLQGHQKTAAERIGFENRRLVLHEANEANEGVGRPENLLERGAGPGAGSRQEMRMKCETGRLNQVALNNRSRLACLWFAGQAKSRTEFRSCGPLQ